MCRTPAFVNPSAGRAGPVLAALREDPRLDVRATLPASLASEIGEAAARGAETVVVAGGDGTLATAAGALVGRDTALGVVPAGTLNHFSRDHGFPAEPAAALEVALSGARARLDAATVNGRTFLNTSAVGAYVTYVRTRERWSGRLGYYGASLLAAVGTFVRMRSVSLDLAVQGEVRRYRTPLVFIGVGEREFGAGRLGARAKDGERALHVLIVRHAPRPRLLRAILRTLLFRAEARIEGDEVVSLLVERCTVTLPASRRWFAVDGELIRSPGRTLEFAYHRDALTVRVPAPPG